MTEIIAYVAGFICGILCFAMRQASRRIFKVKYRVGDTDILLEAYSLEDLKATMDAAKKFTDDREAA